jgi:hypothetical protein
MPQRRLEDEDPTGEEESLEFDGTATDQLDDTYRFRVVAASESENGTIDFDDRGQPRWKWITELSPAAGDLTATYDQLKALDNPALSIEPDVASEPRKTPSKSGYDPYATGVFERPKRRG